MKELENTLIHTFITPGFMGWCEMFLESLRYQHGEKYHVRIDSRNLSENDIKLLKRTYSNTNVCNQPLDWDAQAKEAGVDVETFHYWRQQIEKGIVTDENVLCKIAISVNQRYRAMETVAATARESGFNFLLHSDADVYIRKPLNPMLSIMNEHDISVYVRPDRPHIGRVWGGWLGFRLNENTERFMSEWMSEIDRVPFLERWRGYGQSALWFAIENAEYLTVGDLSQIPEAPRYGDPRSADKEMDLWICNGPNKHDSIRNCWRDLLTKYPRIPLPVTTRKWWKISINIKQEN